MNREIKFRGKALNTGEWVYGSYYHTDDNRNEPLISRPIREFHAIVAYFPGDFGLGGWSMIDVDPKTIGQFTGIIDINGKEIYEGDIVQNNSCIEEVVWDDGSFCVSVFNLTSNGSFAVIDNIHDTPDFFK